MKHIIPTGLIALALSALLAPAYAAARAPQAAASPAASAATAAPVTVDPKIEALAKDCLHRAQTNTFDRTLMTDQMGGLLTPELSKSLAEKLGPLGNPTAFTYAGSQTANGLTVYGFKVTFATLTLEEVLALDATGKIAGLRFNPAQ